MRYLFLEVALILATVSSKAQSRSERFSTFGIIARDTVENTWGIAIATNNLGIGQHGVYEIKPGVGVVVSIAFTEPTYPARGVAFLEKGYAPQQIIDSLLHRDELPTYRQIVIMDHSGKTICYTGNTIQSYTIAGSRQDRDVIVFGNSFLSPQALDALLQGYKASNGKLYKRLFQSLEAGQNAGGQNSGKMSAVLCVRKSGENGFNEADMRVDYSLEPFKELNRLVDKKEGLEILQKARKTANNDSAIFFLNKAAVLFEGWTLVYTELSKEFYKRNRSDLAVKLLRDGIKKDKLFKNCLAWNYFLIGNPEYKNEIKGMVFDLHDWLEAVGSLVEVGNFKLAETTAANILLKHPECSHLNLLLGKALEGQGKKDQATVFYQKAFALDNNNLEALQKIK